MNRAHGHTLNCVVLFCSVRRSFCWLCKGKWQGHGGSYYSCKKFNEDKEAGRLTQEQDNIQKNQQAMQKYNLYREQYNLHQKYVADVRVLMQKVESCGVPQKDCGFLMGCLDQVRSPFQQMHIFVDAFIYSAHTRFPSQLAKANRLLQWSYCLTYFLRDSKEKKLFLFQQEQLESIAKNLNDFVSKKTIAAMCELDSRQWILNSAGAVDRGRKGALDVSGVLPPNGLDLLLVAGPHKHNNHTAHLDDRRWSEGS